MYKTFRIFVSAVSLLTVFLAGFIPAPVSAGGAQPVDDVHSLVGEQGANLPSGISAADWNQIQTLLPTEAVYQQAYIKASNTDADDGFGNSVAVSGNTLVVGAPWEDSAWTGVNGNQSDNSASNSGAAYVFIRNDQGVWSQQAYLKASNTNPGDQFGSSVAISGDTLVVGATGEDSSDGNPFNNSVEHAGAAYVFIRSGTTWSQQAYLKASKTDKDDEFGNSVAISGDLIVVGAHYEDSSATGVNGNQSDNSAAGAGAAYVFIRSGTTWSQEAYLKASNTDAYDNFGSSVAIASNTIAIGAPREGSSAAGVNGNQNDNSASVAGAAYVFHRNSASTWSQLAYLKASNTGAGDKFGSSVATSGGMIVVGAPWEDSNATGVNGNQKDNSASHAGAAYVFKSRYDIRNHVWVWNYTTYLKASNTGAGDRFGSSVAISSSTILVGAPREDSSARGVNGNGEDNTASDAGAAYLFANAAGWGQQSYLKASNTGADDRFGSSVAISGRTIVVGAPREDSSAKGVNGNGGDNSASNAGAAYFFGEIIVLRSQAKYDGWVLESGEFTNQGGTTNNMGKVLLVGDDHADKQYRSILSFGTGAIPDNAVITKVTLWIKRAGVVGTNPMNTHNGLVVDIKKGKFYTLPTLQINDFQAKPGKYGVGNFHIRLLIPGWYRTILNSAAFPYINKQGLTQFRLRFRLDDNDDNGADILKLYSGNAVLANRPKLIVEYYVP